MGWGGEGQFIGLGENVRAYLQICGRGKTQGHLIGLGRGSLCRVKLEGSGGSRERDRSEWWLRWGG